MAKQIITAEQLSNFYGDKLGSQVTQETITTPVAKPSRIEKTKEILSSKQNPLSKGLQTVGQGAGFINDMVGKVVETAGKVVSPIANLIPGIKQFKKVGEKATEAVMQSQGAQDIMASYQDWKQKNPEASANLESVVNIASLIPIGKGTSIAGKEAVKAGSKALEVAGKGAKVVQQNLPDSATIMNRVSRLNPTEFNKFKEMSGVTPGEYLTKTGNFGSPEKIIAKEADKFAKSVATVDQEIGKLPGLYKNGAVDDALNGLLQRAESESGANVKAPYLSEVKELVQKHSTDGLTMEEINRVKRLYEKNVKLGYNKLTNSEKVAQSTNIDNALREWQFDTAKKLGFSNLDELNKQTQLSRFIVDTLGDQVVGKSGLNGINLTDWIVLSNGSPQAVSGFLTKKFFSNKSVQAKIAEFINKNKTEEIITPKVSQTTENVFRQKSPKGLLQLPESTTGVRSSKGSGVPIKITPTDSNMEIISKQGITPSMKKSQPQSKKSTIPFNISVPDTKLLPSGNGKKFVGSGATMYLPKSIVKDKLGITELENATIRVTKINPKTGDVYIKDLKTGKTAIIPNIKKK